MVMVVACAFLSCHKPLLGPFLDRATVVGRNVAAVRTAFVFREARDGSPCCRRVAAYRDLRELRPLFDLPSLLPVNAEGIALRLKGIKGLICRFKAILDL